MVIFQFIFLQIILLLSAFNKTNSKIHSGAKQPASPVRKRKIKAVLFMAEGLLQLFIGWCFWGDPIRGELFFMAGGALWILAGVITFLFTTKQPLRKHPVSDI
jgi:hypothetical protein